MWGASAAKITDEHRRRRALVYVRQSTTRQVEDNTESQRRQYALAEQARAQGFVHVDVIDDDLGCSGSGTVARPGFERLFGEVVAGNVGAVFCLETSRLARNGRDWHTLLEVCRHLGTLIISADGGVADPRLTDDQLVLGVKGTLAEYELSLFRLRGLEARRAKAKRGEYQMPLPAGFVWSPMGTIEKEPNARVRRTLALVFDKFRELGSGLQVARWLIEEQVEFPVKRRTKGQPTTIDWRIPDRNCVARALKNPIHAGAYAWGRTSTRTDLVDGRLRKRQTGQRSLDQWQVLIPENHEGYITWDDYLRNQEVLASNNYRASKHAKRRGRGGGALLAGLLRCHRCGRRLSVGYSGAGGNVVRYTCMSGRSTYALGTCLSFSSSDFDRRVAELMVQALEPMAIDAAIAAGEQLSRDRAAKTQLLADALEQKRYEAKLAERRYQAVDPDNRLVAATLERAWEGALSEVAHAQEKLEASSAEAKSLEKFDQARLAALADDVTAIWENPNADPALKQRIAALLLEEVIVDVDEASREICATLHWRGGRHTTLRVAKRRRGKHGRRTPSGVIELLRAAAPRWSDEDLARLFNLKGLTTGAGNPWTRGRVRTLRAKNGIAAYDPEVGARYLSLAAASEATGASSSFLRRLMRDRILPYIQICGSARFEILRADLERPEVTEALSQRNRRLPRPSDQVSLPWVADPEP